MRGPEIRERTPGRTQRKESTRAREHGSTRAREHDRIRSTPVSTQRSQHTKKGEHDRIRSTPVSTQRCASMPHTRTRSTRPLLLSLFTYTDTRPLPLFHRTGLAERPDRADPRALAADEAKRPTSPLAPPPPLSTSSLHSTTSTHVVT